MLLDITEIGEFFILESLSLFQINVETIIRISGMTTIMYLTLDTCNRFLILVL